MLYVSPFVKVSNTIGLVKPDTDSSVAEVVWAALHSYGVPSVLSDVGEKDTFNVCETPLSTFRIGGAGGLERGVTGLLLAVDKDDQLPALFMILQANSYSVFGVNFGTKEIKLFRLHRKVVVVWPSPLHLISPAGSKSSLHDGWQVLPRARFVGSHVPFDCLVPVAEIASSKPAILQASPRSTVGSASLHSKEFSSVRSSVTSL
jgi:hypothetical protein